MFKCSGLFIGPFRDKQVPVEGISSPGVGAEYRTVDFDWVFQQVKLFVENWGRENEVDLQLQKTESTLHSPFIDANVKAHIEKADFILADISADNRNALLELGYAEGQGKPYVIMTQGSIHAQLPSDEQGRLITHYDARNLPALERSLAAQLTYLVGEVDKRRAATRYMATCFGNRDVEMMKREISGSEQCVHILQTNLLTVNADLLASIKRRMLSQPKLFLRILTLDPQSKYVNERALQLGYSGDGIRVYRNGLVTSLEQAVIELEPLKNQVKIKVYDDFPAQMTYRFDKRLLVCTVSRTSKSRDNASFLIDDIARPGVKPSYIDHFSGLWGSPSSREVFGALSADAFLFGDNAIEPAAVVEMPTNLRGSA